MHYSHWSSYVIELVDRAVEELISSGSSMKTDVSWRLRAIYSSLQLWSLVISAMHLCVCHTCVCVCVCVCVRARRSGREVMVVPGIASSVQIGACIDKLVRSART